MAITRVGVVANGVATVSSAVHALTTTADVAAGDHIIITCGATGAGVAISSVADNSGAPLTYQTDVQLAQGGGSSSTSVAIISAYAPAGLPLGTVITITWNATSTRKTARIVEYSGLDPTTWLDQTASAGTSFTGTSMANGTTATTTQADELVVAAWTARAGTHSPTWTAGSPYTLGGNEVCAPSSADSILGEEYQIVSATGAYTATATLSLATTGATAGAIATYIAAAGGTPQTQTSGFPSSTAASYGPTPVPGAVTEQAGFPSSAPSAKGPTLVSGAVTLTAGFASHTAAADGPALVPGAKTQTAGFASHPAAANGPSFAEGAATLHAGFASHTSAASGPAFHSPDTKIAGFASGRPSAHGADVQSTTSLIAGFAGHTAAASGPSLEPGAATLPAGRAAHGSASFGPTLTESGGTGTILAGFAGHSAVASGPTPRAGAATLHAGFSGHAASAHGVVLGDQLIAGRASSSGQARGPLLVPGAVTLPAGKAARTAAVSGPLLVSVIPLAVGSAARQSVAFGVAGLRAPVILLSGRAAARSTADQAVPAGSALTPAAASTASRAATPPGSTQATAAASTVGVSVNE